MNTDMTNKEIEASERQLDNWLALQWSDSIYRIVERHCDEDEICEAMIELVASEKDEDRRDCFKGALIEAMVQAERSNDSFKHYTHYLWIMSKDWFRDHLEVYEDICSELL